LVCAQTATNIQNNIEKDVKKTTKKRQKNKFLYISFNFLVSPPYKEYKLYSYNFVVR